MLEVWGGLFLGSIVSGLIPFINSELLVIGVAVLVPSGAIPVVAIVAGLGQMMAKLLLYGLARWAPSRLPERAKKRLQGASDRVRERGGATGSVILASAAAGWPPFYGVSLVAGALKVNLGTFSSLGLVGRTIRFGVLAWGARAVGSEAAQHLASTWTGWFVPTLGG
jgi:membrane protein YqaA with SNARE-associated domain